MFYLVDVGVPHLGEEAEGWWGVRVVNWELDVSLGEQTQSTHVLQTAKLDFRCAEFNSSLMERPQGGASWCFGGLCSTLMWKKHFIYLNKQHSYNFGRHCKTSFLWWGDKSNSSFMLP